MRVNHREDQKRKEQEFIHFTYSFIVFLLQLFQLLDAHEPLSRKMRIQMEHNIMTSISILWKVHVSIFSKKRLYIQIDRTLRKRESFYFNYEQSKELQPFFLQLKNVVGNYSFLLETDQIQCQSMLEQISQYYDFRSSSSPISVEPEHSAPPWLAKSLYFNPRQ
ncbi:hypothetical protein [Bacillus tuaregi]|uniref:hypothetical protein n=1 Tax=Bacillus tuaregi TaxID=1816695 RepID=UPI0008F96451|nr:hypothetical protein [Bacillus tuaregi]